MDKNIIYSSFLYNKKEDKEDIFKIYKNLDVSLFTYSRVALSQILKSLNKKKMQTIFMPSLICRDILSSIHALNYKINFYDIDKNLNPIINDDTNFDIILIVNYFGFSQNLELYKKHISKNTCITIEDNSHGFLSRDLHGRLLGTRLDYGFISIYKSINIFNGSILINNTKNKIQSKKLVRKFNFIYFIKKLIYFRVSKSPDLNFKIYNLINFCKNLLKLKNKTKNNFDEINLPNNTKIYDNFYLQSMPFNLLRDSERRRKIYFYIDKLFRNEKITPIFQSLNNYTIPFCYPFYCDPENIQKLNKIANKHKFVIIKWPELPSSIKNKPSFYDRIYYITFKI